MRNFLSAVLIAAAFIAASASQASAALTCSDITPGAQQGPNVPAGKYNPAFTLPYPNSCFVQWPSNNRGVAGRTADQQKCNSLANAKVLDFIPDGGSNFNLCVFQIIQPSGIGSTTPGATGDSRTCANNLDPRTQNGIDPSDPSPADRTSIACAQWLDRVGCRSGMIQARNLAQSNQITQAVNILEFYMVACTDDSASALLPQAQQLLTQLQALNNQANTQQPKPPPPPPNGATYTIQVCNKTNDNPMSVAIAYDGSSSDDQLTIEGWWQVPTAKCVSIITLPFGTWNSKGFYVHAEGTDVFGVKDGWPANQGSDDAYFCIAQTQYVRINTPNYHCQNGEDEALFARNVANRQNGQANMVATVNVTLPEDNPQGIQVAPTDIPVLLTSPPPRRYSPDNPFVPGK